MPPRDESPKSPEFQPRQMVETLVGSESFNQVVRNSAYALRACILTEAGYEDVENETELPDAIRSRIDGLNTVVSMLKNDEQNPTYIHLVTFRPGVTDIDIAFAKKATQGKPKYYSGEAVSDTKNPVHQVHIRVRRQIKPDSLHSTPERIVADTPDFVVLLTPEEIYSGGDSNTAQHMPGEGLKLKFYPGGCMEVHGTEYGGKEPVTDYNHQGVVEVMGMLDKVVDLEDSGSSQITSII